MSGELTRAERRAAARALIEGSKPARESSASALSLPQSLPVRDDPESSTAPVIKPSRPVTNITVLRNELVAKYQKNLIQATSKMEQLAFVSSVLVESCNPYHKTGGFCKYCSTTATQSLVEFTCPGCDTSAEVPASDVHLIMQWHAVATDQARSATNVTKLTKAERANGETLFSDSTKNWDAAKAAYEASTSTTLSKMVSTNQEFVSIIDTILSFKFVNYDTRYGVSDSDMEYVHGAETIIPFSAQPAGMEEKPLLVHLMKRQLYFRRNPELALTDSSQFRHGVAYAAYGSTTNFADLHLNQLRILTGVYLLTEDERKEVYENILAIVGGGIVICCPCHYVAVKSDGETTRIELDYEWWLARVATSASDNKIKMQLFATATHVTVILAVLFRLYMSRSTLPINANPSEHMAGVVAVLNLVWTSIFDDFFKSFGDPTFEEELEAYTVNALDAAGKLQVPTSPIVGDREYDFIPLLSQKESINTTKRELLTNFSVSTDFKEVETVLDFLKTSEELQKFANFFLHQNGTIKSLAIIMQQTWDYARSQGVGFLDKFRKQIAGTPEQLSVVQRTNQDIYALIEQLQTGVADDETISQLGDLLRDTLNDYGGNYSEAMHATDGIVDQCTYWIEATGLVPDVQSLVRASNEMAIQYGNGILPCNESTGPVYNNVDIYQAAIIQQYVDEIKRTMDAEDYTDDFTSETFLDTLYDKYKEAHTLLKKKPNSRLSSYVRSALDKFERLKALNDMRREADQQQAVGVPQASDPDLPLIGTSQVTNTGDAVDVHQRALIAVATTADTAYHQEHYALTTELVGLLQFHEHLKDPKSAASQFARFFYDSFKDAPDIGCTSEPTSQPRANPTDTCKDPRAIGVGMHFWLTTNLCSSIPALYFADTLNPNGDIEETGRMLRDITDIEHNNVCHFDPADAERISTELTNDIVTRYKEHHETQWIARYATIRPDLRRAKNAEVISDIMEGISTFLGGSDSTDEAPPDTISNAIEFFMYILHNPLGAVGTIITQLIKQFKAMTVVPLHRMGWTDTANALDTVIGGIESVIKMIFTGSLAGNLLEGVTNGYMKAVTIYGKLMARRDLMNGITCRETSGEPAWRVFLIKFQMAEAMVQNANHNALVGNAITDVRLAEATEHVYQYDYWTEWVVNVGAWATVPGAFMGGFLGGKLFGMVTKSVKRIVSSNTINVPSAEWFKCRRVAAMKYASSSGDWTAYVARIIIPGSKIFLGTLRSFLQSWWTIVYFSMILPAHEFLKYLEEKANTNLFAELALPTVMATVGAVGGVYSAPLLALWNGASSQAFAQFSSL